MKKMIQAVCSGVALALVWIFAASACGVIGRVTRWAFDQGWEFLGRILG